MKNFVLKGGFVLLSVIFASWNGMAEDTDCNPPRNVRSNMHTPEWYNVNLSWDVPEIADTGTEQPSDAPFIYGTGDRLIYSTAMDDVETRTQIDAVYNGSSKYTDVTAAQLRAMEYIDGKAYLLDYISLTQVRRLGILDLQTGEVSFYANSALPSNIMSMTWHPLSGEVFVSDFYGVLGKLDINARTYSSTGTIEGGRPTALAIDNYGICYGIQLGTVGAFGTVDLETGAFTKIADIPLYVNYIQDIAIDHSTNRLYWIARIDGSQGNNVLYEINKNNGELARIADLPAENEITANSILSHMKEKPLRFNVNRNRQK
jgi:hypothetical protein